MSKLACLNFSSSFGMSSFVNIKHIFSVRQRNPKFQFGSCSRKAFFSLLRNDLPRNLILIYLTVFTKEERCHQQILVVQKQLVVEKRCSQKYCYRCKTRQNTVLLVSDNIIILFDLYESMKFLMAIKLIKKYISLRVSGKFQHTKMCIYGYI